MSNLALSLSVHPSHKRTLGSIKQHQPCSAVLVCSKMGDSYRCWEVVAEEMETKVITTPSQDGKSAALGWFCGATTSLVVDYEYVCTDWPGRTWHNCLGYSRSLWGSSAGMEYESINQQILLVLLLIEQHIYSSCGLQSGMNLIQRLLQMPICRKDMNLLSLKYVFDCNCEIHIKL